MTERIREFTEKKIHRFYAPYEILIVNQMNIDIELIPTVKKSSIKERLKESLCKCENVKGAVAYWTIDTDFIKELALVLKRENSYYCIDLHSPTNIDYLANFKRSGSNIFLHNYEIKKNSENYELKDKKKVSYLLHSKIILFEMPDNNVEIWLGSHNFTQRAILGVNIESSFIVKSNKDSKIYKDVLDYLTFIKDNCIVFDVNDVEFYKKLQGEQEQDTGDLVLELIGENVDKLVDEKTIQLLGVGNNDIGDILGKEIIIQILDLDNGKEYLYKAKVIQAGEIDPQNPKSLEIEFSARRYAVRGLDRIPYLKKEKEIDSAILMEHNYFINLEVTNLVTEHKIYVKPQRGKSIWSDISSSPHLERMNEEDVKIVFKGTVKPIKRSCKSEVKYKEFSLKKIYSFRSEITNYLLEDNITSSKNEEMIKEMKRKTILIQRLLKPVNKDEK
ncbi:MAG: hypothetical protein HWQ38_10170 [Nostoc sp. NMS7]|uniref:hypothetical protein n=1 Tax=Nostoc sp. NMS7 TaxID=2815391 RepID=UPI0025DA5868|nr:hypothetical protein [Nostoc sp. NMS7]MBN3946831.1 hypothetical protein [Nostoc sp. NMS7]